MKTDKKIQVDRLESVLRQTSNNLDQESNFTLPDTLSRSVMAQIYNEEKAAESEMWNISSLLKGAVLCFTITIIALASISWGEVRESYVTLMIDIAESDSVYTELIMETEAL